MKQNFMELNNSNDGGFALGFICVLLNVLAHFFSTIKNIHIPDVVMQLFQIAAWFGAIGVFVIQYKKSKKTE